MFFVDSLGFKCFGMLWELLCVCVLLFSLFLNHDCFIPCSPNPKPNPSRKSLGGVVRIKKKGRERSPFQSFSHHQKGLTSATSVSSIPYYSDPKSFYIWARNEHLDTTKIDALRPCTFANSTGFWEIFWDIKDTALVARREKIQSKL